MEKFMQRESVFVEAQSSGEMDFNDVFGGPPRRFSMQEVRVRYSFAEQTPEPDEEKGSSLWSGLKEKPVFGEENGPRRRHQGDDFFDDIFKGSNESYGSPRRADSIMGSSPGSRIMSPAKPLPPKAEPFSISLPPQLSLPATLTKAMDLPTFGSNNHGQYKMDVTTNAIVSPHSSSSLSRFSNKAIKGQDKIRNEVLRQSPLSRQPSSSSQDSPLALTSDQEDDIEDILEKDNRRNEDSLGNHFHFSIYKWAGRGVPMLMSLAAGNNLKSKSSSVFERSTSSNGRKERKTSTVIKQVFLATEPESLRKGAKKDPRSKEAEKELQSSIHDALNEIPEAKSRKSSSDNIGYDGDRGNIKEKVQSIYESDIGEKIGETIPLKIEESLKPEMKPLRALLHDAVEQQGNITKTKESKTTTPKRVQAKAHDSGKNVKKNEGRKMDSDNVTVKQSSFQDAPVDSGVTPGKTEVKGKVKDFVQIFNQEADSRPKADFRRRSRSSRWKHDQNENEVDPNATKAEEKVNLQNNADKKPDGSLKVDENLNNDETREHPRNHVTPNLKKTFSSETLHTDSKISVENIDDPLEDNFLVQELFVDHGKVTQDESFEDTKAIDAKIKQWSNGKKGNIRSLLSTLQYVLWAESGWKAVPLVDLIEANSVKRAYQKALLRLHPDKLQQKGAAFHHKYIAEKVFDILQEAWDHFNTCSSLNL